MPDARQEPRLLDTLGQDAQQVWTDARRLGLVRSFRRTLHELQTFYLSTPTRDRLLEMPKFRRGIYLVIWLLKSLLLKLTPTRRILLALSFVLMLQGTGVQKLGETLSINIRFPFLGIAVLLLVLMLELKDKLVARSELEAGRSVQQALMPQSSPTIPGWDVWMFTKSANDVGGDLVDYLRLDQDRVGVVLGDVAGKGLPAALLMAKLQSTLRALASEEASLSELGRKMNRILCRDGLPNRFATLVYFEVNSGSGDVRLLNAGHMPPLVLHGATLDELPRGAMALGMLPDASYAEQRVSLQAGDVLMAFSDGLTDAVNAADEFFGDERVRAELWAVGQPRTQAPGGSQPAVDGPTAQQIGTHIVGVVDRFVADQPPYDDLSLVILKRTDGSQR